MIANFQLKHGRAPGLTGEPINATPVVVFVGPNNSGKSKVLTEIEDFCRTSEKKVGMVILDRLTFAGLSATEAAAAIQDLELEPRAGDQIHPDFIYVGRSNQDRAAVERSSFYEALLNPEKDELHSSTFCRAFLGRETLFLNGQQRMQLVNPQPAGDLLNPSPSASLQILFTDDPKRLEVRRIVKDAFDEFFVINPTQLGHLSISLSAVAPASNLEERGIHREAVEFHTKARPIWLASDGVKAFTGIVTAVIAGDPRILLIDEPEAFLHPALAFKLGYEISRAANADKRVFVSTHSPSFVMGCVQSGAPVTIVRLTYRAQVATARALPSSELLDLMRNPLLRSTSVLSGLFYDCAVVTESDADRAFYQEINERLLRFKPDWGIPNCLFLNAQNKQTIHLIIGPLRKLGIPAAAIVDVDAIKEGGKVFASMLDAASVPPISQVGLTAERAAVKQAMDATRRDMKRDGGLSILPPADLEAARNLFSQLGNYGIFLIPGGELESWNKTLGVAGHGPAWLVNMFEKMGSNPDDQNYSKPTDGDVWEFLSQVKVWLTNPNRQGIPL